MTPIPEEHRPPLKPDRQADPVVVVAARRTPIGRFLGSLAPLSAVDLGVAAARAVLFAGAPVTSGRHAEDERLPVDRVVFGCARQAGAGPNPARQIALGAGLDPSVVAHTVNMACASGLEAVVQGARLIQLGESDWTLVGGTESMSRIPFLLDRFRTGYRLGNAAVVDAMYRDGYHCPLAGQLMGETAETLARRYEISRAEQDAFALRSQQRAARAQAEGRFRDEIVPVPISAGGRGKATSQDPQVLDHDEHVRGETTLSDLGKLPPVFAPDGTVTAGNASGITDGAAALVLTRASLARERGLPIAARIVLWSSAGVDPKVMGISPVPAISGLLRSSGLSLDEIDLVELNEAFAAQVLAVDRELGLDPERMNSNGGAIALGHPTGCSGARIVVTLLHEMRRRNARRGLAALCVSGGLGLAALFERDV